MQVIGARAAMERLVLAALLGLAPIAAGAVDLSRAQATLPEQNLVVITHEEPSVAASTADAPAAAAAH